MRKGKKNLPQQTATHFHPRRLARGIIHSRLERAGATGVNKVVPGTKQSKFAQYWRDEAEMVFGK